MGFYAGEVWRANELEDMMARIGKDVPVGDDLLKRLFSIGCFQSIEGFVCITTQTTASCSQEVLETEEEQKPQCGLVSGRSNPFVTL